MVFPAFAAATTPARAVPCIPFATTRVSSGITTEQSVVSRSIILTLGNMRKPSAYRMHNLLLPKIGLTSQLPDFNLLPVLSRQSVKVTRVEHWVINRQTDRTHFRCHVFERY